MKKFSNINESVWGDVQRRGMGVQKRKEDDVDLMDIHQLYDYIKTKYADKIEYSNFTTSSKTKSIGVEVINGVELSICYLYDKFENILIDVLDSIGIETRELLTDFDVETIIPGTTFKIKEKNQKETKNSTFIKLLDFVIDNTSILFESIWGDVQRRGMGVQKRKEDSYNFNIDKLEEVDLGPEFPILFADTDLVVNGELYFDWDQVENMLSQIKNTGWRLPLGPYEMKLIIKLILKLDHISTEFKDSAYGMIKNEKTGEYVSFATPTKYGETYWCEDDYSGPYSPYASMDNQRVFEVGNNYYYGSKKMVLLATNNLEKTRNARIRLVKDK